MKEKANQYVERNTYYELTVKYLDKTFTGFIDKEDYPLLSKYTWHYHNGYFQTSKDNKKVVLHRLLVGEQCPPNMVVDHINRNRLDNRRSNLRFVSHSLNSTNACIRSDKTQDLPRGINYSKGTPGRSYPSYNAQISIDGKREVRTFSTHKYGEQEAKRLAIQWREEQLSKLKIQSEPYESKE